MHLCRFFSAAVFSLSILMSSAVLSGLGTDVEPRSLVSDTGYFPRGEASSRIDSENIAGLFLTGPHGTYESVTARFDVPNARAPDENTVLSTAIPVIGIDRINCTNFLVAGIEIHVENNVVTYEPVYQWYPQVPATVDVAIVPNQELDITVRVKNDTAGLVSIINRSNGQSAEVEVTGAGFPLCRTSAVWGLYAVGVPLANFGNLAYDGVSATLTNGTSVGPMDPNSQTSNINRDGMTLTEVDVGEQSVGIPYL